MRRLLLPLLLVAFMASTVLGQITIPRKSVVRVHATHTGHQMSDLGSGVAVLYKNKVAIFTAYHVVKNSNTFSIKCNDKSYTVHLTAFNKDQDLAMLVGPGLLVEECAILADTMPKRGGRTALAGYGQQGIFKAVAGQFLQPSSVWVVVSGSARSGDSGGPIFNEKGEVIAILWGTVQNQTYASAVDKIRDMFEIKLRRDTTRRGTPENLPKWQGKFQPTLAQPTQPDCDSCETGCPPGQCQQSNMDADHGSGISIGYEIPLSRDGPTFLDKLDQRLQGIRDKFNRTPTLPGDAYEELTILERMKERMSGLGERFQGDPNRDTILSRFSARIKELEQRWGIRPLEEPDASVGDVIIDYQDTQFNEPTESILVDNVQMDFDDLNDRLNKIENGMDDVIEEIDEILIPLITPVKTDPATPTESEEQQTIGTTLDGLLESKMLWLLGIVILWLETFFGTKGITARILMALGGKSKSAMVNWAINQQNPKTEKES